MEQLLRGSLERELRDSHAAYAGLVERNEARLDKLSETHAQIIESRLGIGEQVARPVAVEQQPIGRKSWKTASSEYEKRQREAADRIVKERDAYWTKKIEETEARDKAAETK